MKDKEILSTVHRWIQQANSRDENPDHTRQRLKDFQSFIEQEWQKRDEQELVDHYNRNREVKDHITDVSEKFCTSEIHKMPDGYSVDQGGALDERHRGLEIDPDGTVTKII